MALPGIKIKFEVDPSAAKRGLAEITKSIKATDGATNKYKKGLVALERAQKTGSLEINKYDAALKKLSSDYLEASQSAAKLGGLIAKVATPAAKKGLDDLQKSLAATDAATRKYQQDLEVLKRSLSTGLLTTKQYDTQLKKLEADFDRASVAARRLAGATTTVSGKLGGAATGIRNVGKASGRANFQIQNTAFQLQDIAVQIAGGQGVMRALGQQIPQLAGAFGKWGAIIGVVAAVGLPVLAIAFQGLIEETKTFEERLDNLQDLMDAVNKDTKLLSKSNLELGKTFGFASGRVRTFTLAALVSGIADANNAMRAQIISGEDYIDMLTLAEFAVDNFGNVVEDSSKSVDRISRLMDVGASVASALRDQFIALNAPDASLKEQQEALANVLSILKAAGKDITALPDELRASFVEALRLSNQSDELSQVLARINLEAGDLPLILADTNDIYEDILGTAEGLLESEQALNEVYADRLKLDAKHLEALEAMLKATGESLEPFGGAGRFIPKDFKDEDPTVFGGGGGGGGGELDALIAELQTEQEIRDLDFQNSLELLMGANERELEVLGGFNEAKLRLEEAFQEEKSAIERAADATRLQNVGTLFGNLSSAFASGSGKMLKISKAFGIASGLINAYGAYLKVLDDPSLLGTPIFRQVLAGSTLAAGLAQVANIRSVSPSGGGGGAAAAAPAAAAPAQTPLQVRLSGLSPSDLISGNQLSSLFDKLQDEAGDRGLIVSFAT